MQKVNCRVCQRSFEVRDMDADGYVCDDCDHPLDRPDANDWAAYERDEKRYRLLSFFLLMLVVSLSALYFFSVTAAIFHSLIVMIVVAIELNVISYLSLLWLWEHLIGDLQ